eukprot:TRINITY_DN10660_c0_g1_i1.p1 TRINITY_DN10660_c0_g1~~TRINITY_DN10660_c0_g1_i1.p1  ORF type:complete len:208 (+),score=14.26 TRINITY_DN10660_c0_g1_i1:60-626(+)
MCIRDRVRSDEPQLNSLRSLRHLTSLTLHLHNGELNVPNILGVISEMRVLRSLSIALIRIPNEILELDLQTVTPFLREFTLGIFLCESLKTFKLVRIPMLEVLIIQCKRCHELQNFNLDLSQATSSLESMIISVDRSGDIQNQMIKTMPEICSQVVESCSIELHLPSSIDKESINGLNSIKNLKVIVN